MHKIGPGCVLTYGTTGLMYKTCNLRNLWIMMVCAVPQASWHIIIVVLRHQKHYLYKVNPMLEWYSDFEMRVFLYYDSWWDTGGI